MHLFNSQMRSIIDAAATIDPQRRTMIQSNFV